MKVLGLITARGGSQRVKGKNLRLLGNIPLIEYTFKTASESKLLCRILLSTDDIDCVRLASKYPKVEVPFMRPKELATDLATDLEVVTHALDYLWASEGTIPDIVVHLRPTSPLRKSEQIDEAVSLLHKHPEATSVRTVTKSDVSLFKLYLKENEYLTSPLSSDPELKNSPDQILPITYRHVGYVDAIRTSTIRNMNSMTGDRILPFFIPRALPGINTEEDLSNYEAYLDSTQ